MNKFQSFHPREYLYREYDFVAYVSRSPDTFLYLGLIERDSMVITIEDVRSTDEETGGELLYYKVSIEFRCVQLNLTTVKGVDNYEELTKGKWFLYLECVQDKNISFSTPTRVALKTKQVARYNEQYTDIQAQFLVEKIDWLKGDRFSDPVFIEPNGGAVNVALNTPIVIDVERDIIFDLRISALPTNTTHRLFQRVCSTTGLVDNVASSDVTIAPSPNSPNFSRITFTIPALQMATRYRIEFVGRKFGYTATLSIEFSTFLSAPDFVPPTPLNNAEFLFLDQLTVRTQRTNSISQTAVIRILNTTNPANPVSVIEDQRVYNTSTNLSLDFAWRPLQYGVYTIQVRDRANGIDSQAVSRSVIFTDRYEELASRSNVFLAWNSLKAVHEGGIVTSLQLDGQGIGGERPNLNFPTNSNNRPLLITDSSHKGYSVLYAQGSYQRRLYAYTPIFTGSQLAIFLFKKTSALDISLFGANIPSDVNWGNEPTENWRIRSFEDNFVGQSYWSPETGEQFDNLFQREFYERDASGNVVANSFTQPHPLGKWVIIAVRYNIPVTVASFALFGTEQFALAQNTYLSIGFILNSSNWADRQDFVNYLTLFL